MENSENTLEDELLKIDTSTSEAVKRLNQEAAQKKINVAHTAYETALTSLIDNVAFLQRDGDFKAIVDIETTLQRLNAQYAPQIEVSEKPKFVQPTVETTTEPTQDKDYHTLDPRIARFYEKQGIELNKRNNLYINVLLELSEDENLVPKDLIEKKFMEIDPENYKTSEQKSQAKNWNKIYTYLNERLRKRKGVVTRDEDNYGLTHYTEIQEMLAGPSEDIIDKIQNDQYTAKDYIADVCQGNIDEEDIRDLYFKYGIQKKLGPLKAAVNRINKTDKPTEEISTNSLTEQIANKIENNNYTTDTHIIAVHYENLDRKAIQAKFVECGRTDYSHISRSAGQKHKRLTNNAENGQPAEVANGDGISYYIDKSGCAHRIENTTDLTKALEDNKHYD